MEASRMTSDGQTLTRLLYELPDVIVVLDAEGQLLWANARAEGIFGRTLEEYQGRSALDLVHPDDLELVGRSLVSVQAKEIGTTLEVRANTPTGWRLLELIGTPVSWFAEGAVLFSMRDLTDRRRFEVARDEVARFRSLVHRGRSSRRRPRSPACWVTIQSTASTGRWPPSWPKRTARRSSLRCSSHQSVRPRHIR
jgi:PAS domain S-box-containing protein